MDNHTARVKEIQEQVRQAEKPLSFSTKATSNTLRHRPKGGIRVDALSHILDIQPEWVDVEPRVSFKTLCQETLKRGLIPPVVPEFTSITVGGAVMGAALESSSHTFGQVNDTCLEYEVILGNGEVVHTSPDKNPDLFYALSGSYGTLGILTRVRMRLIPAKKYVHLTYHPLKTAELLAFLTENRPETYVEGIALDREGGIATTGEASDRVKGKIFRQNRYFSPWYVQHLTESAQREETMLLEEYLFRLDPGAFWMGQYVLSIPTILRLYLRLGIPKIARKNLHPSLLFRLLFGWALTSERLYHVWHRMPNNVAEKLFFVHDFYTPFPKVEDFFLKCVDETEIFPIWLCPIRGTSTPQILAPHYGHEKLLNIGLYGMPKSALPVPDLSAKLENEIALAGGRKMLYSFTYYDKPTFSKIYNERAYTQLRADYFAEEAFPHIYNKIVM